VKDRTPKRRSRVWTVLIVIIGIIILQQILMAALISSNSGKVHLKESKTGISIEEGITIQKGMMVIVPKGVIVQTVEGKTFGDGKQIPEGDTIQTIEVQPGQKTSNSGLGNSIKTILLDVIFYGAIIYGCIMLYRKLTGKKSKKLSSIKSTKSVVNKENLNSKNKVTNGILMGVTREGKIIKPSNEQGHVAIVGGSRTGKSSTISIPSLLQWEGSAIVNDIKGELADITAKAREKYGRVHIFNPDKMDSACYNPLEQVKGIDGANALAKSLIPTPLREPFFAETAQGVFASATLDGLDRGQSFCEICERVLTTKPITLIEELTSSSNRQVRLLASACNDTAQGTLGSVFTELRKNLLNFASDENIARVTSKSDFTPETLENGATIYLQIHESMLEQYKGLMVCIISQTFRFLSKRKEGAQPQILMLLDELPRLGKIEGLTEATSTLAGRNVHLVPMLQSLADLDRHYGDKERKIIMDNCPYKVVLGCGDYDTQKYFSDMSGTEKMWQNSYSHSGVLGQKKSTTNSIVEEKIFKPEEFGNLKQTKKAIIFGFGEALEVDKLFWFENTEYKKIIESCKEIV
jgi:type IV secretion system protein VirD4